MAKFRKCRLKNVEKSGCGKKFLKRLQNDLFGCSLALQRATIIKSQKTDGQFSVIFCYFILF